MASGTFVYWVTQPKPCVPLLCLLVVALINAQHPILFRVVLYPFYDVLVDAKGLHQRGPCAP
jgi:hypothetical protein